MAGRGGFEPPPVDPESTVLPLDDLPASFTLLLYQQWKVLTSVKGVTSALKVKQSCTLVNLV